VNSFDRARELYAAGKRIVDASRDKAVTNDELRWAREDLEDVLLDLKLGVIELNEEAVDTLMKEARIAIAAVLRELL
jgi:hypothetical protein